MKASLTALLLLGPAAPSSAEQPDFRPPRLSFTAADFFASNGDVNSLPEGGVAGEAVAANAAPHVTVYQAAEDGGESPDEISSRAGPLLTLFPGRAPASHVVTTPDERRSFLSEHGKACHPAGDGAALTERHDLLASSPTTSALAVELWKYCALHVTGGVYVDASAVPLAALGDVIADGTNLAVVSSSSDVGVSPVLLPGGRSISDPVVGSSSSGTGGTVALSSFLALRKGHGVAKEMVGTIVSADPGRLETDALLLPRALMRLVERSRGEGDGWALLDQRCHGVVVGGEDGGAAEPRSLRGCPSRGGYCCEILGPTDGRAFLLSGRPLVPVQVLPGGGASSRDGPPGSPFVATVVEDAGSSLVAKPYAPGSSSTTPNAYELIVAADALPNAGENGQKCMDCLREKKAADCTLCAEVCPRYCEELCAVDVREKPVSKVLTVRPPRYRRDPDRLVPRIVHQTWFEQVTPGKYPNMNRLAESWRRSGWEYRFWDDASAADFLSGHFPPEVREAYDAIIPGAFRADLFRYCVLLVLGGVYSDMDVMLESNLDAAVPPDVGFMTPFDAPGSKPDHRMCLWNGMIASAPGHPFLSRVIEHVVNNIRNRYTVVDHDRMMCPDPEMSVMHAFSTLFVAGPCILGLTVNEVMGRDLQKTFVAGDLERPGGGSPPGVPGRTVILNQDKWDMGAHRFTWVENNLVVAATDMPDYDDREDLEEAAPHYSKTADRTSIYGVERVYTNPDIAHERIVFKTEGFA